jgi:hypothetical protein
MNTRICLPRFGSKNLVPVEEATKAGERITMPKRGVNWAFLKINTN